MTVLNPPTFEVLCEHVRTLNRIRGSKVRLPYLVSRIVARSLLRSVSSAYALCRLALLRQRPQMARAASDAQPTCIIVTFGVTGTLSNGHDWIFGSLEQEMRQRGLSVTKIVIVHGRSSLAHQPSYQFQIPSDIPLNWGIEMRSLKEMFWTSARCMKRALSRRGDRWLHLYAAEQAVRSGAQINRRLGLNLAYAVSELQGSVVLTSLEGHVWEQTLAREIRNTLPRSRYVGYMHAPTPGGNALFMQSETWQPPISILTAGVASAEQAKQHLDPSRVFIVGSHRAQKRPVKASTPRNRKVLFVSSDRREDYEVLLSCARFIQSRSSWDVTISRHPSLAGLRLNTDAVKEVVGMSELDLSLFPVVVYQRTSFPATILDSDIDLIHVEVDCEYSLDVIPEGTPMHHRVGSKDQLLDLLRRIQAQRELSCSQIDSSRSTWAQTIYAPERWAVWLDDVEFDLLLERNLPI